jgi:hypothetical protein
MFHYLNKSHKRKTIVTMNKILSATWIFSLLHLSLVHAEVTEFGGHPARFKGNGDLQPPLCHIEAPTQANSPFFIQWNCTDNESSPDELRSEVWLVRKNAPIPYKVTDFLGFPASVRIEKEHLIDFTGMESHESHEILRQTSFEELLPVGIRLLVRDRSGNASLSPVLTVEAGSSPDSGPSLSRCSLLMQTNPVPASIEFSGAPALFAEARSFPITSLSTISGFPSLRSSRAIRFDSCEIDEICPSGIPEYQFQLTMQNQSTGTLVLIQTANSSNRLQAHISGDTSGNRLRLNGSTNLPSSGVETAISISCE